MLKKFLIPIVFVSEWILFYYVMLLVLVFNMSNFANVLFVDMDWEEPNTFTTSTSSFFQLVLLVVSVGVVCFLYINYFTGTGLYKRLKAYAWGILFAFNSLACIGYLFIWYDINQFDLRNTELNLLLLILLASVLLTMQIMTRPSKTYN